MFTCSAQSSVNTDAIIGPPRYNEKDDQVLGKFIPAGTTVACPTYTLHRDCEKFWFFFDGLILIPVLQSATSEIQMSSNQSVGYLIPKCSRTCKMLLFPSAADQACASASQSHFTTWSDYSLSYHLLCGNEPNNFRVIVASVLQKFELSFPKDFDAKKFDASYKVCSLLSLNKTH